MIDSLRDALQVIANSGKPEQHEADMAALKKYYHHSIQVAKELDAQEREGFNCYMFALGIENEKWARSMLAETGCPSSTFMEDAISNLGIGLESNGQIVVYRDNAQTYKHMGIVQEDGSIISKWGTGRIWRHGILEVPAAYGDFVGYITLEHARIIWKYFLDKYNRSHKDEHHV